MTAVISKIISMQPNLTVSENEISQYVMNHTEDVIASTITSIAKKTNTSEASINRFCKKLGFKGFNSFKVALAQENYYYTMKSQGEPENATVISSISRDYRQMIMNTSAMLDEDTILKATEGIKKASRIFIFSMPYTTFTAAELEFKLCMVGMNVKCVTDPNSMRLFTSNVQSSDLVIVIVPTISMREIYQSVRVCKDRGAKVLSITSYDSPKLNDLVDFKFVTSDKITARNSLSLSNNIIFLYVVDVLYSTLLNSDKNLRQKKLNNDAILEDIRIIDNYL